MVEITSLLDSDDGGAVTFATKQDYFGYIGDATLPILPWETTEKLQSIIDFLETDIKDAIAELEKQYIHIPEKLPTTFDKSNTASLNIAIEELREYRRKLFAAHTHAETQALDAVEKCIADLQGIYELKEKKPVELERLITQGLNVLNDALDIHPNYPVGDDNQPTFTAPAGKPDIECFYTSFNSVCEVTLLKDRSQWFNEGQPVMRHFRNFEEAHTEKQSYCLFIAPSIHQDTLNTFWTSVKYEYQGHPQKIIPVTIKQFISILTYLLENKRQNPAFVFTHKKIQQLFENVISETQTVPTSTEWLAKIPSIIDAWGGSLAA
ncbi:MAG: hypothetical protein Ta2A_13230 [Treponemataceae bacterium]|nr:MAG: hypothetical protein Ta2A_13230 [Treponemataceae bacterium]